MSLPPFAIRPKKKGARQRRLLQAAPASSAHSAPKNITFDPEDAKEDQRDEKAIEKIEDHLLKMFRQESKMPVAQLATDGAAQQQQQQHAQGQQPQPSAQKPVAFRLELLPQYFRIEGLSLALPYSVDNQRFLQMLEQGRLPWEHLRSLPGLREMCADKYQNGGLTFEVQDRRVPEHCYDSGLRHVHVAQDDDVMLQDLQQACMVNMMSDDPNVMPWTDEFKIFLEALLVSHISPAPCLHPSLAVGRLCNMLQFNRLKLNSRRLRTVSVDLIPLPLKRSRFAPATYGSWVRSQHAGQQSAPMLDQPAERSGKRVRKPTAVALENMQGKRDPDDPLGMKLEPQATGSMALGGNAPLGDPYARPYSNGGKGPRAQHGGKGGKGPPGGKAAVAPGARGKGIRPDGDEREPPPPGANFSLLARLAVLSGQQSQSQLQRLPQGGDAFNQIATKAMRDSKMTPHHDEHAIARCRGLQPEDLLPTDLPLPPHGSHDPLNVSKTLTFGVESRQSLREADGRQERHELRLNPSDATGRHQMSLIIADDRETPERSVPSEESPLAQITFHTHGSLSAHALMRQWQDTHLHEQRAARQRAQHAQQQAAMSQGGGRGGNDRYASGHSNAGGNHQMPRGGSRASPSANVGGAPAANRATPPMMQRSASGNSGQMQMPRAMQAEMQAAQGNVQSGGSMMFPGDDFTHGLASPMGLGQMGGLPAQQPQMQGQMPRGNQNQGRR